MPIREQMHSLGQEIIDSYEARVRDVADIRKATHGQVRGLDAAHNTMAHQLRADLSRDETARRRDEAQRARERAQVTAERRHDVSAELKELDRTHNTMAHQLRADLAKGRSDLSASVNSQRADLAKGRSDLRASVSAQLQQVDRTHNSMARQQRADLAKGRSILRADVNAWMKEVATAHAGAQAAWQELTATMAAVRSGGAAVAKAPAPIATAVAAPAAPVEEATEEEGVAGAEVGEVTTEFAALREESSPTWPTTPTARGWPSLKGPWGSAVFRRPG